MEHLLRRVGFEVQALYGDFFRQELRDESSEMIWIARNGQRMEQKHSEGYARHPVEPGEFDIEETEPAWGEE
jgi:hypothetical protein